MMLEPYFFQPPDDDEDIPDGVEYRVVAYARVGDYTLVEWRYGGTDEFSQGESLYRGKTLLVSEAGQIPLYSEAVIEKSEMPQNSSVWDVVDRRIGRNGIPPAIAIALRSPAYRNVLMQ